jgi:hypothetical protein
LFVDDADGVDDDVDLKRNDGCCAELVGVLPTPAVVVADDDDPELLFIVVALFFVVLIFLLLHLVSIRAAPETVLIVMQI